MVRKFNLSDSIKIGRLLTETELIKNFSSALNKKSVDSITGKSYFKTKDEINFELFDILVSSLTRKNIEVELYDLISSVSGIPIEELQNIELEAFINIVKEILNENGDMKNFFQTALVHTTLS
jgi:ATP adenylyltransferase/5',5'''-P-1,P-4-tetraphosphate phosphorylase II